MYSRFYERFDQKKFGKNEEEIQTDRQKTNNTLLLLHRYVKTYKPLGGWLWLCVDFKKQFLQCQIKPLAQTKWKPKFRKRISFLHWTWRKFSWKVIPVLHHAEEVLVGNTHSPNSRLPALLLAEAERRRPWHHHPGPPAEEYLQLLNNTKLVPTKTLYYRKQLPSNEIDVLLYETFVRMSEIAQHKFRDSLCLPVHSSVRTCVRARACVRVRESERV